MFQLVKGSAVIGILLFAFVSFWPALDSEHKGAARVITSEAAFPCRNPPKAPVEHL